MKYKLLSFLFFINVVAIGQNDLKNIDWYLQYIVKDNIRFDNYYFNNNLLSDNLYINFTDSEISGKSTCNWFGSSYILENTNEIKISGIGTTLLGCEYYLGTYEWLNLNFLSFGFSYQISGEGNSQILTLTRDNGDYAVYAKTLPAVTLFKTWYLTSIETNTDFVSIPNADIPSLNLTPDFEPLIGMPLFNGFDGCNSFNGFFDLYYTIQNTIKIIAFAGASDSCGNSYSGLYSSIISNSNDLFYFSMSPDGTSLVLTNDLGEKLTYSDKVLSINGNEFKNSNIQLSENPVNSELTIAFSKPINLPLNYIIYSSEGKMIESSVLQNNSIEINNLPSGFYFLKLVSQDYMHMKTLKFIKE